MENFGRKLSADAMTGGIPDKHSCTLEIAIESCEEESHEPYQCAYSMSQGGQVMGN